MFKLPTLEAKLITTSAAKAPRKGHQDIHIVAVFQAATGGGKAVSPKGAYGPIVERLSKAEAFSGGHASMQFLRFGGVDGAESGLLVGLGAAADLTEEKARSAGGHVWTKLKAEKVKSATVLLDTFFAAKDLPSNLTHASLAQAFAEGLLLGAYEFTKHKSGTKKAGVCIGPERIVFATSENGLKQQLAQDLPRVTAMAEAMRVTRDWSNEPSNFGTPEFYANEARKLARQYGLKCRILTERDAAREKMGLFLGVGQGAEREGRIVVLEYTPKARKSVKTVGLVGKGITFDSGGISLKPGLRMEDMKHDMTGAATVMGATMLAAAWKVPNRVVSVMAFTENMPDGTAIQPGNVLTARNGKTVEIINTDAEGRLILADVLDYIQDFKPDAVIDAATLTGAVLVALGKQCCGVLGNDDALIESLKRAGEMHGERMWQLPMFDEYFEDIKSDTADIKNSANDGNGGTIRGAMFLKQFIRKGTPWVHMDIAGMAYGISHLSYMPKRGATGFYVRTLAQFAADF